MVKDAKFLHAANEDADQTARMCRLICVFIGHTCRRVQPLTLRLIDLYGHMVAIKLKALYMHYVRVSKLCWDRVRLTDVKTTCTKGKRQSDARACKEFRICHMYPKMLLYYMTEQTNLTMLYRCSGWPRPSAFLFMPAHGRRQS